MGGRVVQSIGCGARVGAIDRYPARCPLVRVKEEVEGKGGGGREGKKEESN